MKCSICKRPAPDPDAMIDEGWIPGYYHGQQEERGPVCPECCRKHLQVGRDGEWETTSYRWN